MASMLVSKGEVIAVPTDTVYGLVCELQNFEAVDKIFRLKQRPENKPLVALCSSIEEIEKLCIEIPALFYELANKFLPGPLTIILKKSDRIPINISCGLNTIGVRISNSKFVNELINLLGEPLASTSANVSDRKAYDNASDVYNTFSGQLPLVIDGGKCPIGTESTVIDLTGGNETILREGYIKKEELDKYLSLK